MQRLANVSDGVVFVIIERLGNEHFFCIIECRCSWPSPSPSSGSGSKEACLCSFSDEISFKLSQRPKDMKDQLSSASCGVNIFRDAFEADLSFMEGTDRFNEVFERPA